jgi:hypothetical protein
MQKSSATSELYDDSSAANFFAQPKFLAVDFRKWHLADIAYCRMSASRQERDMAKCLMSTLLYP